MQRYAAQLCFGLLLCSAMGCASRHPVNIAFIPRTTGTELWEAAHTSADRTAHAFARTIYWNAPTREDDVQGQLAIVEQQLKRPLAGLIVCPDNALALLGALNDADQRKIPVAVVQTDLPLAASPLRSFFVNDEDAMGRLIAEQAGKALHGRGMIAIVGSDRTSSSLFARLMSIQVTLRNSFPGIQVMAVREGTNDVEGNQRIAADTLALYPGLGAIVALNSTAMEGVLGAVRGIPGNSQPLLFGCGQELDVMEAVRLGQIDAIAAENTYLMASKAVQFVVGAHPGSGTGRKEKIEPVLVTRDNIDSPAMQLVLSSGWRPR